MNNNDKLLKIDNGKSISDDEIIIGKIIFIIIIIFSTAQ